MPTDLPLQGSMLGAALTVVGLLISWIVWRRKGAAAGLRGVAWSLLPLAAGLMGLMTIVWRLAYDLVGFFAGLVFNPVVWAGVALAALSVVLWLASGLLRSRGVGTSPRADKAAKPGKGTGSATVTRGGGSASPAARPGLASPAAKAPAAGDDDDFGDIEEMLRKRGIS